MENRRKSNIISSIIRALLENTNNPPCKKTMQKIVYLIEEAGEDLGYDYSIHFYGPYSAELDYEIQRLANDGDIQIEYTQYGHRLKTTDQTDFISLNAKVKNVIDAFGTKPASELELLATTLFVQRNIGDEKQAAILTGVKSIKGDKYTNEQINEAVLELQKNAYFDRLEIS